MDLYMYKVFSLIDFYLFFVFLASSIYICWILDDEAGSYIYIWSL